jgi:hypothetical protein
MLHPGLRSIATPWHKSTLDPACLHIIPHRANLIMKSPLEGQPYRRNGPANFELVAVETPNIPSLPVDRSALKLFLR